MLNICKNCGECEETTTPKGEHKYGISVVEPTCVSPGYTVKECEVCGDRHITDIQNAKPHSYEAITTPANCENGGYTLHLCKGCGSSFITDYTDPLGHSFDEGTVVTSPSCTGEGVTEYRCERCGYHYVDGNAASGHKPGEEATCTNPQLCTVCGAVITPALGHSFKTEVTAPTCTEMGFTTYTCERCGESYNITVKLPDGTDMDENNRITVIVTDNRKKPLEDENVTVKGDLGQTATGKTDEDGTLTVPAVTMTEKHGVYIFGYPDGTFGTERNMTRSEAAAIFARLLAEKKGDSIPEKGSVTTKYTDIPSNAWYAGYVKYLTNYGVVYGRGDKIFAPEDEITRAEFTVMAVRFFEVYGEGAEEIVEKYEGFSDVSSGYWAAEYIKDAAIHGWVFGYGDGTFHADANITRAEVVSLMNRMLGRTPDKAYIEKNIRYLNTFSDLSRKHWAYLAVMEAANAHTATLGDTETWSK